MAINFDFGSIKEKMGNLAQAGVAQGKKVASIAKLKADNMAQQDAIRKAYFAIGKAYYAKMQGQPDEEFAELCGKVDAAMAAIAANNAALKDLKAAAEVVIDVDITLDDVADETAEAPAAEEAAPAEETAPAGETAPAEETAPVEEPTVDDVVVDVQETVAEVTEEAPAADEPKDEE